MSPSSSVSLNSTAINYSTFDFQGSLNKQTSSSGGVLNTVKSLMTSEDLIHTVGATQHGPLSKQMMMQSFVKAQKQLLQTLPSSSSDSHLDALNVLESRGFQSKPNGLDIPIRANGLLGGMRRNAQVAPTQQECNEGIARNTALIAQMSEDLQRVTMQLNQLSRRLAASENQQEWAGLQSQISALQSQVGTLDTEIINAGNRISYFQQHNQNRR